MSQSVRNVTEEYWRPADPVAARVAQHSLADCLCTECESECSPGARFCHVCGKERAPKSRTIVSAGFNNLFDLERLCRRMGLSVACLVFLILGLTCLLIAATIGIVYRVETLFSWQAVQLWRIEWLLGAIVAVLVGLLLKTTD